MGSTTPRMFLVTSVLLIVHVLTVNGQKVAEDLDIVTAYGAQETVFPQLTYSSQISQDNGNTSQEEAVSLFVNVSASLTYSGIAIEGFVFWVLRQNVSSLFRDYILRVSTISNTPHCENNFHPYEKRLPKSATSYKIPRVLMPYDYEPKVLQFHCSYSVELALMPCDTRKKKACLNFVTNFTIGECVGNICECNDRRKPPPPYNLMAVSRPTENDMEIVSISWTYDALNDNATIAKFKVIVCELLEHIELEMYSEVIPYNVTITNYTVACNLSSDLHYEVRVSAIDHQTCESRWVNRNITKLMLIAEEKIEPDSDVVQQTVVICVVTICSATGLIAMSGFYAWRKRKKQLQFAHVHAIRQSRIGFHSSSSSCVTRGTLLSADREDFNLLYVEQEIQEARDKGEVDSYEISYNRLTVGPEIGKGAFGRVCIATAEAIAGIPGKIQVAVKYLRDDASSQEKLDFLAEIKMMKSAGRHDNVVTMLACCILREPHCMVMEFIAYGDLQSYLRKLRSEYERKTGKLIGLSSTDKPKKGEVVERKELGSLRPRTGANCDVTKRNKSQECLLEVGENSIGDQTSSGGRDQSETSETTDVTELLTSGGTDNNDDGRVGPGMDTSEVEAINGIEPPVTVLDAVELQDFALQIASGMKHLSQRGIVHRDLAARNVLINENKVLKISDFGLSRTGTYVLSSRSGRVPLRWLSVEAFRDHIYSTQSDVWSYGIVLWEICTLGGFPYSVIADTDLFEFLLKGNRLEQPVHCSDDLYAVMQSCWRAEAVQRPNFVELCLTLENLSKKLHTYVNFDVIYKECDSTNLLPPIEEL